MRAHIGRVAALMPAVLSVLHAGCDASSSTTGDAEVEVVPGDAAPDEPAADGDDGSADAPAVSGSMTLVVTEAHLSVERRCDLNGDGLLDNALADLGNPASTLFAMSLDGVLNGGIASGVLRFVAHLPHVDDRAGPSDPETTVLLVAGRDVDVPPDPTDDFSGEEPFWAEGRSLDGCGEPRFVVSGAIDRGSYSFFFESLAFPMSGNAWAPLRNATVEGEIAPFGSSATLQLCGYALVHELGDEPPLTASELSLLEELLGGGAVFGVPAVPGLTPDLDLDGDGLERLLVDEDGRIEQCVDGDGSVIPGRDCWSDERIADAFSIGSSLAAVPARLAGQAPGWSHDRGYDCPEGRPEASLLRPPQLLLDECVEEGEVCEPYLDRPCCDAETLCSGASSRSYRCRRPCAPIYCEYGERLGSCFDVLSGSAGTLYCHSLPGAHVPFSACEAGSTGCTTSYGVSTGTLCSWVSPRHEATRCFEECPFEPLECPTGSVCIPEVVHGGGACVDWSLER